MEADGNSPVELKIETIRITVEQLPPHCRCAGSCWCSWRRQRARSRRFELSVEQRYDEQVAKIGSWYKRWSRVVPGIVGLVVAALNLAT